MFNSSTAVRAGKRLVAAVNRRLPFRGQIKGAVFALTNTARALRGGAFVCNALAGASDYNICVNSDMTVSCNCLDIDGSGQIGDLRANALEEIFRGPTATRFRRRLARGMLAIPRCATCRELRRVPSAEARAALSSFTPPRLGLMVENTVLCNLHCTNCSRKMILKARKRPRMSLADVEKVAREIEGNRIAAVNFFNLGEPFLSDTVDQEIAILKRHNPRTPIYVSTNGALINQEKKYAAALQTDHLYISLDGASEESVAQYQRGGSFEATYRNMRELVRRRNALGRTSPVIEWKYVVFSWNDSETEIARAIALAREAGVDILSFWAGEGSPEQVSARFKSAPFFQQLGSPSWKGREIDFRREPAGSPT